MIRYLIKNNLKLMFRSKWIIGIMILGPVLVIAVLSSAFRELMEAYEDVGEFEAGFRVEADMLQDAVEQIRNAGKEAGIILYEYPEGEVKELMENNNLAGFADIGREVCTVYESADYAAEGIMLEYFISKIMTEGKNAALRQAVPSIQEEEPQLPVQQLAYMPAVSAGDYYGIVQIVYFIWLSIVCAAGLLTSEKKNGINRKFQVSPVSGAMLYTAKWISMVLATLIGIGTAILLSAVLMDVHWGNLLLTSVLIVLVAMASTAFGLMIYYLCENIAVTVILLFAATWFMGFFGGCFETYMYSSLADAWKNASPIYHVNRALVEYSCMGESTYTASSMLYMLAIVLLCSGIAIAADKIRKRGRA